LKNNLPESTWSQVFDLLVKLAGAKEVFRSNFITCLTGEDVVAFGNCYEYRFQGDLGFGGKLRYDGERLWVTCYAEDETPGRLKTMDDLNEKLELLVNNLRDID